MKKIILATVATLSALMLKANDFDLNYRGGGGGSDNKLSLSISIGGALPLSAYGATGAIKNQPAADSNKIDNGYANLGYRIEVSAAYMFTDVVGAQVMIGGNLNSFNKVTYAAENGIQAPATYTQKSYFIGQFMVGPCLSFGDLLKFNIRGLVGLATSGAIVGTSNNGASGALAVTSTSTSTSGSAFGYDIGIGLVNNFNPSEQGFINVDYFGATMTYPAGGTVSGNVGGISVSGQWSKYPITMALALLNFSVGLTFNL